MTNVPDKISDYLLKNENFKKNVKYELVTFEKNDRILKKDETYPYFYILNIGTVWVVLKDASEEHINPVISEIYENEIFGAMGAFKEIPANANVIALTKVEAMKVDTATFFEFIKKNPEAGNFVYLAYINILFGRINRLNEKVLSLLKQGIELRKSK